MAPRQAKGATAPKRPAAPRKAKPTGISVDDIRRVITASRQLAHQQAKRPELSPFRIAEHPKAATPRAELQMAQDSALNDPFNWAGNAWAAGDYLNSAATEGQAFLGYPYLAELAQRPEYRVISETIATEMTRKWIRFKSSSTGGGDKTEKIKQIEAEFDRLEVRDRFKLLATQDGFFGRSHLFLDFGKTSDEELKTLIGDGSKTDTASAAKIKKGSLKRLQTVEAVWAYPTTYNATNPLQEDWYNPQVWYVMGKEIHASRLMTFIGHPVPDLLKPAYSFGGLSLSQMAQPYVDIWLTTRQSVGTLIHSFSVMVLMTDLSTLLQPGQAGGLLERVALFNALRDNQGTFVVNKNTEDFKNVSAPVSGLAELQSQAQEHMMSVARIPAVKFTGIQPTGLNASSEGEIRVFYDTIHAYQQSFFRPNLTKVFRFVQLSLWGAVDPDITFEFVPLWALSEKEEAELRKIEAETDDILVNGCSALRPEEVRQRVAADPDTPYTGLDVDDVPEQIEPDPDRGLNLRGNEPYQGGEAEDEAVHGPQLPSESASGHELAHRGIRSKIEVFA